MHRMPNPQPPARPRPRIGLAHRFRVACIILCLALPLTGCLSPHKTITALASNPASVDIEVRTPWGTTTVRRRNPCACPPGMPPLPAAQKWPLSDLDVPTGQTARPR